MLTILSILKIGFCVWGEIFFDPWTKARLDHIRNHKGNTHTPDTCKDISFVDMKSLDKNFTHHALESGVSKKTGLHKELKQKDTLKALDEEKDKRTFFFKILQCPDFESFLVIPDTFSISKSLAEVMEDLVFLNTPSHAK